MFPLFRLASQSNTSGLCQLTHLRVANFSYNYFIGGIPSCMNYLPRFHFMETYYFGFHTFEVIFGMLFIFSTGQVFKGTVSAVMAPSFSALMVNVRIK